MATTVLRKMLLGLTSKASAPASRLLPSDLPCVSSTLHTYNVHSPSGERGVVYKNECEKHFKKKESKPCL